VSQLFFVLPSSQPLLFFTSLVYAVLTVTGDHPLDDLYGVAGSGWLESGLEWSQWLLPMVDGPWPEAMHLSRRMPATSVVDDQWSEATLDRPWRSRHTEWVGGPTWLKPSHIHTA